ncbi:MAG TPA: tRNA preQ1(34) S-adenosylmethionine ribosyltransferase-isomerase QueA [Candidatus Tectomicrobia bacterium]|nr:tRNA preQ1(34) S-adenosylmethionine ribosyltransferase-isomerase QueA [Candidatus Tectomicrobia bacterium]
MPHGVCPHNPDKPMQLDECDYELPSDLIAQHPLKVRDQARLLILDRGRSTLTHAHIRDLPTILTPRDVLVINDTKVFPARLLGQRRGSGGHVEILLLRQQGRRRWQALVKPSHRLAVGAEVTFAGTDWIAIIGARDTAGTRQVDFRGQGAFRSWLARCGQVPLPPYIKRPSADDASALGGQLRDSQRYQTVYAKHRGSVAAPTAGLHLTRPLLRRLQARGVDVYAITLHVGPGTFRPLRSPTVETHIMDAERYCVPPDVAAALEAAKAAGKRLIAVGTTSARTLESAFDAEGRVRDSEGNATLFIYPGYRFKMVDSLLTNFHLPRSTPLLLTMALAGRERILAAYREAIAQRYRFYSYGDAMLIL